MLGVGKAAKRRVQGLGRRPAASAGADVMASGSPAVENRPANQTAKALCQRLFPAPSELCQSLAGFEEGDLQQQRRSHRAHCMPITHTAGQPASEVWAPQHGPPPGGRNHDPGQV